MYNRATNNNWALSWFFTTFCSIHVLATFVRDVSWFTVVPRHLSTVYFLFKASLHTRRPWHSKLWPSSNSGRLTVPSFPHILHHANLWLSSLSCFLLAWFVWLTCSMSGFPDVGYTTVAHYTLSGELYTFPSCPRGFLQEKLLSETKPSAVLCCNRHISLDSFRHALHTKENFHQSTSVASYWQKTDIIHMNTKAWLWVNGPWFLFSSSQALQTSWEFFVPVSHSCSLLFHYKN